MSARSELTAAIPDGHQRRFTALARQVSFPAGTRVFEEGGRADRFWIIRGGAVALDVHVPGRHAATVETLGPGELLGWSWLVPPHQWHLGAETRGPVRADEFDAVRVRELAAGDPVLGKALAEYVATVVGERLRATRTRLLDLYGPWGGGGRP